MSIKGTQRRVIWDFLGGAKRVSGMWVEGK